MDNDYISSTLPKTFVEVNILLLHTTSSMDQPGSIPCYISLLLITWLFMMSMELWT